MFKHLASGAARVFILAAFPVLVVSSLAAADVSRASKYSKFVFKATQPIHLQTDSLHLESVELFVVRGDLAGPKFLRAHFHARVGQAWQELDTEITPMEYTDQSGVAKVHAAIAKQAAQFAETVRAELPQLDTTEFPPNAVVGVTWANNFEGAMKSLLTESHLPWINSEIAVGILQNVFRRQLEKFPALVRVRHLSWMPPLGSDVVFLEMNVDGTVDEVPMAQEERYAITLRLTPCNGALVH